MTATPPPPPPYNPPPYNPPEVQEKAPPVAWLIPVAGLLALIGGLMPWFRPELTADGKSFKAEDAVHSWDDGKIGLVGPILLIALAVAVAALLLGRSVSRFERGSAGPVVTAARSALIVGAVGIVASIVAFFLLKSQYKFETDDGNKSWDDFLKLVKEQSPDAALSRGIQFGFWLTVAGAVVAVVGGVLTLVMRRKPTAVAGGQMPTAPGGYPPPAQGGPAQQFPPAAQAGPGQQFPPPASEQPAGGYPPPPPPTN